jgi:flagellar assembly factor FliW
MLQEDRSMPVTVTDSLEHALIEPGETTTVVRFPEGLPGFEGVHDWQVVVHQDALPFFWIQAIPSSSISLLIVDPKVIAPNYAVTFSKSELARIGLSPGEPHVAFVVVTLRPEGATANLRAPLVINPARMIGAQVILDDAEWPLRRPVFAAD